MQVINDLLNNGDWGAYGDYEAFDAWLAYRRSDGHVLPFAGGWFDQPKWIRKSFATFDMVETWHQLNDQLPAPAPAPFNPFVATKKSA